MYTKKSPTNKDQTLLREHYMKMKKLTSFLLHSKSTIIIAQKEIIVAKRPENVVCEYFVIFNR